MSDLVIKVEHGFLQNLKPDDEIIRKRDDFLDSLSNGRYYMDSNGDLVAELGCEVNLCKKCSSKK